MSPRGEGPRKQEQWASQPKVRPVEGTRVPSMKMQHFTNYSD